MRLAALAFGFLTVATSAQVAAAQNALTQTSAPQTAVSLHGDAVTSVTPVTPVTVATPATGPTTEAARAGVAPQESQARTANTSVVDDRHVGAGQNVALMVVGGAALITGLIIGGDGGTLVAVGGAVVGLLGLYNFIK